MTEPIADSLDELIEQIATWPVGMPVRLMEQVKATGETAVPALDEALAVALAEQGRAAAIPLLYEAYQGCEPWQRIEFEGAIRRLHCNRRPPPLWTHDWRLRYRRLPPLGGTIMPGWVTVAALAHQDSEVRQQRVTIPLRSLEQIIADQSEPEPPAETCEECGAPVERPTGIPVCHENALATAFLQNRYLTEAREDGIEDLFDLLDELEERQWAHQEQGEPVTPAVREHWHDEKEELRIYHQTCRWLIEQGAEQVG